VSGAVSPKLREVHHGDGVAWLRETTLADGDAIVTSLPDHSELPELGVEGWKHWFVETAELVCKRVDDDSPAIFYQTDVKHDGRWIDKSFLVAAGAERAASHLLWHKIACRSTPGTTSFGRPAYGHILCFSRTLRLEAGQSSPDVLPTIGEMVWPRAMGSAVCASIIDFLIKHTNTRRVVDPFCGHGSILAAANARGLTALGVERSRKRVEKARALSV